MEQDEVRTCDVVDLDLVVVGVAAFGAGYGDAVVREHLRRMGVGGRRGVEKHLPGCDVEQRAPVVGTRDQELLAVVDGFAVVEMVAARCGQPERRCGGGGVPTPRDGIFVACLVGDANVAALGEMWKGGGAGCKNLVMVTLGTGVGGGVIVGGKIVVGQFGAGGEIGHMCVNYHETKQCGCGSYGCLEQYASATGIVRLATEKLESETRSTLLKKEELSAKAVFDAVKEGDEVATEIATEMGEYLGHALANIAAVLDPAIFVIGGGVSKAGDVLLPFIEKPFKDRAFFASQNVKFALATLGNDAGICGAAKMVLGD